MKILAVDDDVLALNVLQATLEAGGYTDITSAQSGAEALAALQETDEPFDCFLLDILMPEMDGVELCTEIRSMTAYQKTPVLMITGLSDQSSMDRAYGAGATDFVTKPFNGLELGARIRAANILSAQVNQHKQFEAVALQWRKKLDALNALDLGDTITLQGFDGAVDTLMQENILMRMPDTGFSGCLLGVRLMNIAEVFEQLSATDFRAFINRTGALLRNAVAGRGALIAYEGDGNFLVMSPRPIPKNRAMAYHSTLAPEIAQTAQTFGFDGDAQILLGEPKPFQTENTEARINSLTVARKSVSMRDLTERADTAVASLRPKTEPVVTGGPTALTMFGDVSQLLTRPKAVGRSR
ncbi:response regulator [Neptunicoccus sediminis]|uniref:response regulator n=1 Tax=Neptunicoccus sediminis TaxID=1892596 RepID=UPI000845D322|nr:response regulator [Neptunicoccus sediminis]